VDKIATTKNCGVRSEQEELPASLTGVGTNARLALPRDRRQASNDYRLACAKEAAMRL